MIGFRSPLWILGLSAGAVVIGTPADWTLSDEAVYLWSISDQAVYVLTLNDTSAI